jgi:hypothetical protein
MSCLSLSMCVGGCVCVCLASEMDLRSEDNFSLIKLLNRGRMDGRTVALAYSVHFREARRM